MCERHATLPSCHTCQTDDGGIWDADACSVAGCRSATGHDGPDGMHAGLGQAPIQLYILGKSGK